ncbi:stAR-related lipid transfer protein 9 [Phyllobates terribilis]|uniref:stAR-related lipid transfer protein 9 n=1 Tax=Phyllobates terribilis TaxID=111132 RepID=UPI003CCAB098
MANVRVALRVRPLSRRENGEAAKIIVNVDEKIARIRNIKLDYKPETCGGTRERLLEFGFDYCYWSVDPEDPKYASQEVVFQDLGTTILSEAIKGYNVCLFAYGQTGSGKTYTMMGTPESIGLTPRICEGLFSYNDGSPGFPSSSRIEVSFLEIYNERVRDLLHQSDQKKPYTLRVREHPEKGPYVQGLSQHVVTDYEQVVALLEQGMENRITAATHVHDASSRSHAIFTIQYTQAILDDNLPSEIASKIHLVDLAGSERASPNYCKDRLTEGSNINRSLVTLGIVISALAQNSQMTSSSQSINSILSDGDSGIPGSPSGSSAAGSRRQPFVPYRDSILTWLLKDSLGGNSKTIMIATVSPASSSYNETMSTLRYASNAKNIINKPRVNEDANVKLIRELREEINRLKAMLRNFEMRTISPAFSEERDGNLTELVLQNELKIEQLTKDWTDKWTDKAAFMEQYNVDINEGKSRVTIDSGLPHLIAMDDDILSTGVVIYYLREGTTIIGSGDHDIVLQGENIRREHCVIQNKFGIVELQPSLGAQCTVNGQQVKDACRLSQGAIIVLGQSHRFRFNHPAEAAVLRQMRSDSQASSVSDCSLDWLDLSGDFSSSSKGNSLILNTSDRNSNPASEEYQQGLRELEATYRKQIEEQQKYVEELKSQIQAAQVKGEKELEHEQSLINQQIQENQHWLIKEKERLNSWCQQKQESSSQTEPKTYAEAEVQNCVQTDIQPSLEELEGKKLVQLELLRKCSLRKAERNVRRKRVKLQLERIIKKQKLLEAKKTLQQLQAACWLSDDLVKPTLPHVPKVQETTALHRSSSSPSGFTSYRRCSLPWTLQTLPNSYSAVLKRKSKSELAQTSKTEEVRNPFESVSIDCLLNSPGNSSSNGQSESNPYPLGTKNLQRIDLLLKQVSAGSALLSSDPQMSKKRQKMDKPKSGSKGSSNNFTAEQPKRRTIRATPSTGAVDTKFKPLKNPLTVGGPKKGTLQEKSKIIPKSDTGKLQPPKSVKQSQISPGEGKPPSGGSTLISKPARQNTTSLKSSTKRKPPEKALKITSAIDSISKVSDKYGEKQTRERSRISTERLSRGLLKSNGQTLGHYRMDDHTDSSDSESYYSIDSLSSAYASALSEQLKQEELQRHRNIGQKDTDSEDSQMSQDSLAEKEKKKEKPNKRRFNKYKTIGVTSDPTTSLTGDHNSFPLVTTGSVTTALTKSFSLDSLADAEDVLEEDSSEELPAEIFWKLQSPRNLIFNEEEQNKQKAAAAAEEESDLDVSNSFYLKVNDGAGLDYGNAMESLSNKCEDKSQPTSLACDSAYSSPGLSSQTDGGNPVLPEASSPACASTSESQVSDEEITHSHINDNVSEIESIEGPPIKSVQHMCVHSVPHTETPDSPANACTVKESGKVQEERSDEKYPPDFNYLVKICSTDFDSPCCSQNNSRDSPESSLDHTKPKRTKSDSESKNNIASPLETPVTCTKNLPFRNEIQREDEQMNRNMLHAPMSSEDSNKVGEELCSEEQCRIPTVGPMAKCYATEKLHLLLTSNNLHGNNITTKSIAENTNYVMPLSLQGPLEILDNQYISPISEESITSGLLSFESMPKKTSMGTIEENDQLIFCDSNAVQLLQNHRSTLEQDINSSIDVKNKKHVNPVQEMELCKDDHEECSVQKHNTCENGKIGNTNSRPVDSSVDISLPVSENQTDCSLSKTSLPVQPQKAAIVTVDPASVTKLSNHLFSDGCINPVAEYNNLMLHKTAEGLHFMMQDDLEADIAENSSSMKSVVVTPSENADAVVPCVQSKLENIDRSDVATYVQNYKEKVCSPTHERTFLESKTSSESHCSSAKACSICKPVGSSESQNTMETSDLLCSECTINKGQTNNEVLAKAYPKEIHLLRVTNQTERTDNEKAPDNHLDTACDSSKHIYIPSTVNVQSSNMALSTYDNTQPPVWDDASPEVAFKTYSSCLRENVPFKHAKLRKCEDMNFNDGATVFKRGDDLSSTMDFPSGSDDRKLCNGPVGEELESAAEGSSTGPQPEQDAYANHYLVEDRSGTCLPLPYYEAKMQNGSFCKVACQTENLDRTIFCDSMDSSKEIFTSKESGLNISISSSSIEKEATGVADMDVKTGRCSRILNCTEVDGMAYSPQNADLESIDCSRVSQGGNATFSIVMPKPYDGSQDSKKLNSTSKCSYTQNRSEDTGDTSRDEQTQEDNLVQQNKHRYKNVFGNDGGERNTRTIRHVESAPYVTEEEYTNLKPKDAHNLSFTQSFNSTCFIKSDTLQDVTADYPKESVTPHDQYEERTINSNPGDPEMLESREETYSGHRIKDKMCLPTCRSSPHHMSVDAVKEECNIDVTPDLSNGITATSKVECELKPLCDPNLPWLTHSSRAYDIDCCTLEDNDSSISVGEKRNGGLQETCPMTTGEYSPDLSESTDFSSSDTDTSKYFVLKNITGLPNGLMAVLPECESCSPVSKEAVNEISQSSHFIEDLSPCTDSINTPSPDYPNVLDPMDSMEPNMSVLTIQQDAASITSSMVDSSGNRTNFDDKYMNEHRNSKIKSEVYAQHNRADHSTQTGQSPYPTATNSILLEGINGSNVPDQRSCNFVSSHQAEPSINLVDLNTEGLHFSSSDINPFVHSWQQEDNPKPGWRSCTFNSASDVSCPKFREQADKLMRCSSVDEGLNSHNSPFHSHLSAYANAKAVSSTISSLGRNDSRPDITSLDDSQELLSDESAVLCTGDRAEFGGISGLQTKFEDYSQLDEIIFLYTSESETCNEPVKRVSSEQGPQVKHKHRKTTQHQRSHIEMSLSKQMRNRNAYQRPASWSNVQNMSLHLSQLLQETSELLGNLSKHNPDVGNRDVINMQRDSEEHNMRRSMRDSSTQTSVDRGIQTESQMVTCAQNHAREHNHLLSSSGINVIVKVLGTDSLTHIPLNTGLTEQNCSKVTKTRTQSLPNLHECEPCKQSERVLYHSPQVRASTPFLNGSQDVSATAFPYSFSKSSSAFTNVSKCAEDTVVNSPSSSMVDTARYHLSYREKTAMVDRASSPILTVKASKKFHHKLVPDSHLNNQNFAKILRNRKRKERELRDIQLNSSQTETDSESNAGNAYEATLGSSLKETTRKRVSTAKFQRFVSEGCILRDTCSSFTNHSASNSEITGSGKRCNGANGFTSSQREKALHPWEHLQSLQNISLMSQSLTSREGPIPRQNPKEFGSDNNDLGSFTVTSGTSFHKNRSHPYSPSQMGGFDLHLQEDGLSVVESESNTDILLGQEPTFKISQKPHSHALQDLPMHNKFSNWSGVQCSATKNGMVSSSPELNIGGSPTRTEASQEMLESRSQEIERLQRERAEVLSAIHLEMNPLPLTVQLAEAKLSYGIGETDALLRVIKTGKMDLQDTVSIKKQLYERHLKVIENLRKDREERLQSFRRSRSLSPQKQLSASQTSLASLRESDLPSRRREYLQQLRRDVVDNTRIQEPKIRALQCPSEIEVMLKDYQKAREEAKTEIAKARDKLRERAEMERRRLQQGSLSKEDTKMKTLVSTSTLFTNSSLSLSSGPTSGYNSGMTTTIGQYGKVSSHETLPRSLDQALGSGRGRSAVRNSDLFSPTSVSVPDPKTVSCMSTVESLPGKPFPCPLQHDPILQPTAVSYQELATKVQASAMAEVMTACSYDIKQLYNRQAAAGWIYQSTERDVLVYYKAFSSATKHGFIGAGVIRRPIHDVWCMVKDISTRRLYDQSILTACVHERVSSNIQLVHVMTDTSLCYLKQPRDFCCIAVAFKQEQCYSLCFQSVYNEDMPRPSKDTVRGELLPSAWILQPDNLHGEDVTRVIYMIQVDLGAPAIPSRLLSVISKRQPLVIANLATFLSR